MVYCGAILSRRVVQREHITDNNFFLLLPENSMHGIYTHEEFMKINQDILQKYFTLYNTVFSPEKMK